MLLQSGELAVLSEELHLLGRVPLASSSSLKYCLDFEYFEREQWRELRKTKKGYFAFLFPDAVEWQEVEIETNHQLSKFKPGYRFSLISTTRTLLDGRVAHPLGLELLNCRGQSPDYLYLVCNCSSRVLFYCVGKDSLAVEDRVEL
jgi:hypothetical protein